MLRRMIRCARLWTSGKRSEISPSELERNDYPEQCLKAWGKGKKVSVAAPTGQAAQQVRRSHR